MISIPVAKAIEVNLLGSGHTSFRMPFSKLTAQLDDWSAHGPNTSENCKDLTRYRQLFQRQYVAPTN